MTVPSSSEMKVSEGSPSCCFKGTNNHIPHMLSKLLTFPGLVGQVVNIPSFMVGVESQRHIDFSFTSPLLESRRVERVRRRNQKAFAKKASGGDGVKKASED